MSTVPLPPDYYELPPRRRPRNWKRIIGIGVAAIVVLVIGLFLVLFGLLQNHSFRMYVLRRAQQSVSDALGSPVQARDFTLHLSGFNPSVDMHDVVVTSAPPYSDTALLQIDRLTMAIRIDSIFQRKWYFSNIEIEHPVARVLIDEKGNTNLPQNKRTGESQTNLFDLGVRHVALTQGEVYYNDHKSAIDADIHDVAFQSGFDVADKRYSGSLSYSDGRVVIETFNPMIHSLEAKFQATPTQFKLERAFLKSGPSQIDLSATIDDYVRLRVQAGYQATLDSGDLRQIMKNASLPIGIVKAAGSLQYYSDPDQAMMQTLKLDGNLSSGGLLLQMPERRLAVSNVSARYSLEKGDLIVRDMRANALGGGFTGELTMRDITGAAQAELHAALRGVALAQLQKLTNSPLPRDVALNGTANADVDASWNRSFNNLVAKTDANLRGSVKSIPVSGDIHARYDAASGQISFTQSSIRTQQTSLNLNGTVSERASLQVRLQSNDLGEVETIANLFQPMQPLGLGGTASFVGSVRGSTNAPQISGQLEAAPLHVRGTDWRLVRTNVDASPSRVRLMNGQLETVGAISETAGRLTFNADVGLSRWTFTETSPIDLNVKTSHLNAGDLVHLAGKDIPLSGTLSADVSLHGSQLRPNGQGTINLARAIIYEETIDSATVNFQGTGDQLRTRFGLKLPAGTAQGNVTYFPKQRSYDGQLQATGIRLEELHAVRARNPQLIGVLDLRASGTGTIDNPQLKLTAQIPRLQIQNQTISGVSLQADVADHAADFALDSQTMNTFLRGRGRVSLQDNYDIDAALDTSTVSLQPLIALYLPAQANNVTGQTELHAKIRGPLKDKTLLDAHVTIPVLTLNYGSNVSLGAAAPIQVDYSRGVLTLQKTTLRGTGTDLQLQGTIPVNGSAPPSIQALGAIDLQTAELVSPDITSSGQVKLNITGGNTVQGQIQIVNANFAQAGLPLGLQNGNGVLQLTSDRIEIQRFTGNVGSGTLTAHGGVTYRPATSFNVTAVANGVRLLFPDNVRETVDANLTLLGTQQAAVLRGQVRLQQISFTPDFDLADLMGQFSGASTAPVDGFARNLRLDIGAQSTNDLNLVSSKLSLQGAANLQVRGTAAEPVLTGRMNLTGGDLIFRGNRYLLEPSTIDFVNPYRTEPVLNLAVESKVSQYHVQMRLRGPIDHLQTTYSSDPALPPADIINLLVFGKTTEATDANPTPGNLGAESLIASSVSNQITNRVERFAGISHLAVDPVLGDSNKNPGARITLQQRVTGNLFVTFSADVTGTEHEVIKLEYQKSRRTSLSAVRDQNGGFAVDVRIRKTW